MRKIAQAVASASFVLVLGAATAVSAAGMFYDCTLKQTSGPRGWVSERMGVIVDPQGKVLIVDGLTVQFDTGPRPARVRKNGDTLRLNWSFENLTDITDQIIPKFSFTGTLDTATGAIKVRGKPPRFPESVRGQGRCVERKNMSRSELNRLLRG